jgi:hypothetical protein
MNAVHTLSNWVASRRISRVVYGMFCSQSLLSCEVFEAALTALASCPPPFDQSAGRCWEE